MERSAWLINQVLQIAELVESKGVRTSNNTLVWHTILYNPHSAQYERHIARLNLYNGILGIAIFFAAVEKLTGNNKYRYLIHDSVDNIIVFWRQQLKFDIKYLIDQLTLGLNGIGGILYSLSFLYVMLHNKLYLEFGMQLVAAISVNEIRKKQSNDVYSGNAGLLLGLLSFYDVSNADNALDLALICGETLIDSQIFIEENLGAWKTLDSKLHTGFSHGASGIAYSLLRLWNHTHIDTFVYAAQAAIDYEDLHFSAEHQNWYDLRHSVLNSIPPTLEFMTSWCHGAPGIGLSRVAGLFRLDTVKVRRDIEAAIFGTLRKGLGQVDDVCCGNSGRIEFLIACSSQLGRTNLLLNAYELMLQMTRRADERKGYRLFHELPPTYINYSFFKGLAGIGYTMLRILQPNAFPSIVLMESVSGVKSVNTQNFDIRFIDELSEPPDLN